MATQITKKNYFEHERISKFYFLAGRMNDRIRNFTSWLVLPVPVHHGLRISLPSEQNDTRLQNINFPRTKYGFGKISQYPV